MCIMDLLVKSITDPFKDFDIDWGFGRLPF